MIGKRILSGINKISKSLLFSLAFFIIIPFIFTAKVSAQNSDLEAQFSYKQAEDALAKDDFSSSVLYLEKAAKQLGKTNQKILSLQFQAYAGQLKKDCTHPLLMDKAKIDSYLKYYFHNFSTSSDKSQVFEVMEFRDKWNDFKGTGCKEPKYLNTYDIGIYTIEKDDSGFLGDWVYIVITENNIFKISDPKYIRKVLAVSAYTVNGKTTYTEGTRESYTELFNNDLKNAQRNGVEKINISFDVCLTRGLMSKKHSCTTITGSILNPLINK